MGFRRLVQSGKNSDIPATVDMFWDHDPDSELFMLTIWPMDGHPEFLKGERIVIDNVPDHDFDHSSGDFQEVLVVRGEGERYDNIVYSGIPLLRAIQYAFEDLCMF